MNSAAARPRIAAVLFDLDGVLVDSTALIERVWRRWAAECGIDVDALVATIHGRPAREVIAEFTPDRDPDVEARRLDGWEMARAGDLTAMPGALDCVALARRHSWAVVTSGLRELALGRLDVIGMSGPAAPVVLITADDVTRGKPDPEPYLLAAERLRVSPRECVVVEDAPAGIRAGKRAGMTTIGVATTHAGAVLSEADLVLASMREVRRALARLVATG